MGKIAKYVWVILFIGVISGCSGFGGGANKTMSVKEIGSFHVGGRSATLAGLPTKEVRFTPTQPPVTIDPNGEFEVEQMYAQYTLVADKAKRSEYPIIMIHGGGLSGVTWETKPDGKPGWQMFFLRHGYDVYVADAVERGRASWARYPEIFKSELSRYSERRKRRGSCSGLARRIPLALNELRILNCSFQWITSISF